MISAGFFEWHPIKVWVFGLSLGALWYLVGDPMSVAIRRRRTARWLRHSDPKKRTQAAREAASYPSLMSELKELLRDGEYEVKRAASCSLEILDPSMKAERIRIEMEDPDPEIRALAREEWAEFERETKEAAQTATSKGGTDVEGLNTYCVVCGNEFGPALRGHCTANSLVAIKKEGFLKRRITYFDLDGDQLDEADLCKMREREKAAKVRAAQK